MRILLLILFLFFSTVLTAQTFWDTGVDSTQHKVDSLIENLIVEYFDNAYFNSSRNARLIAKVDLNCLKDSFSRKVNNFSWLNKNNKAIVSVSIKKKFYFDIDDEVGAECLMVLEETSNSCGFSFQQHRIWTLKHNALGEIIKKRDIHKGDLRKQFAPYTFDEKGTNIQIENIRKESAKLFFDLICNADGNKVSKKTVEVPLPVKW